MLGLELVVILGLALLIAGVLARRLNVAVPVPQLAIGILLGLVPTLRHVQVPPEIILLVFLPPLLYWESLSASLRGIRNNLRVIVLMSTLLVVATAGIVAVVAHQLGLPWGPAWALGAAVAPTDATAVGVLARAMPRRTLVVMRAESLVNDGTALVIYGVAVGITVGGERLSALNVSWLFLLAYGGGALAGIIVAWAGLWVRRRLHDPLLENVAVSIVPFAGYLLAEAAHASGVLAVVVAGLISSQASPRVGHAGTRQQTRAFWGLATYLINGALFVLIGLEVQQSIRGLTSVGLTKGLIGVGLVSVAVVGARFLWLFTTPYIIRALDRRPAQRARRASARSRVVSAVAGFRGAVSLAAALALPMTIDSGAPFPGRDEIVFITTGVIVVTLVGQALLLPAVIRWARFPPDDSDEREQRLADETASDEAIKALPELATSLNVDQEVIDRIQHEAERHMHVLHANGEVLDDEDEAAARHDEQYTALRRAVLAHKRETVIRLRDDGSIDDNVLLRMQNRLDAEELRLQKRAPAD